ncbi:GPI ethanolamine phosphate transferase 3-like isoform X1 [Centruroides sculpturatus]|uniref:GPI ethanolamine phosphate transferase 3-like isoform X1 n=1 Tax=Centruroides sculpturatus TaxID=218467 RepID=UPI000C6CA259|nr:GPI ethanolamine phosphate transferase 3-like isoform X1 [Centruroides sculpturatus]
METVIHVIVLFWVISLYLFGLWIFSDGFLLKRNELELKSTFNDSSFNEATIAIGSESNKFPVIFNRSIIVIVDALRYDFVRWSKGENYYKNKFTILDELRHNGSGMLFKFRAHPPTTTMQRLKGLTTGGLPTFIDISANFASSEINEDNIIHQLVNNGKKIVFMGDDTWESLYPGKFLRSYAFPSFNVKDLHTVDNGIIQHLLPEMEKTDWNVIISHFLGVDHCGHRYGPSHPEMSNKLYQMDTVIRDVIQNMKNDTILFVFGDHGMTRTGDHGGDSEDEIYSALFIYNPALNNKNIFNEEEPVINQIDLVPTFSLLLGMPIPFSNLGSIIVPLFASLSHYGNWHKKNLDDHLKQLMFAVSALSVNSRQVHRYISMYNQEFNEISPELLRSNQLNLQRLEKLKMELKTNIINKNNSQVQLLLEELYQEYTDYLLNVRSICEKMWAKFNISSMIRGIFILICAILTNAFIIVAANSKLLLFVFKNNVIICAIITPITVFTIVVQMASIKTAVQMGAFGYALGSVLITLPCLFKTREWKNGWKSLTYADKFSTFITLLSFLISFSNSFVINENMIIIYFLLTMLIIGCLPDTINQCRNNLRTNKLLDIVWYPVLLCMLLINVRIGGAFFKCREEQLPCNSSSFLVPLSSFPPEWQDYRTLRLLISCISVVGVTIGLWCWFYYKNRLTCHSPASLCAQYSLPIATLCICFYWTLGLVSQQVIDQLVQQRQGLLPQTSIVLCCITIFALFVSPLLVGEEHSLSGVGTLFVECTYSLGLLLFSLLPMMFLIAGDGLAPSIVLIVSSIILYLYLLSSFQNKEDQIRFPWHTIVTWNLFVSNGFFITGHQYSFTSIHWQAAFVATSSELTSYIVAGFSVISNTFSSHFLLGIALPMLLTCPQAYRTFGQHKKLKINLQSFRLSLLQLFLKYILFNGIKVRKFLLCFLI